jgi:hypothetical protein
MIVFGPLWFVAIVMIIYWIAKAVRPNAQTYTALRVEQSLTATVRSVPGVA